MKDALEAIGYSELRDYQRKTIEACLSGRDVFVSTPSGAGSIDFRSFYIWRGLQCHRVGDCSVYLSHERSVLKPKFPWH